MDSFKLDLMLAIHCRIFNKETQFLGQDKLGFVYDWRVSRPWHFEIFPFSIIFIRAAIVDFNISFLVMKQTVCCCSLSLHGLDVFL